MKKFLLSIGLLAAGTFALQAEDITVTLKFTGSEDAYKRVTVYENFPVEPYRVALNIENDVYEYTYEDTDYSELTFFSELNANIEIIGPDEGEETGWILGGAAQPSLILLPNPENNGLVFTINVTGGDEEYSPLYLACGGSLNEPYYDEALQGGEKSDVWTGTFTLPADWTFRFVRKKIVKDWIYDDELITYVPIGPDAISEVDFTEEKPVITGKLSTSQSYYWVLQNREDCVVNVTVDLRNETYSFEYLPEGASMDLNVSDISGREIIYNLKGQIISPNEVSGGLYIINGKKVIIK